MYIPDVQILQYYLFQYILFQFPAFTVIKGKGNDNTFFLPMFIMKIR